MKRLPPRELIFLCSPLLLLGCVGFLLSRRESLDVRRVSLHLYIGKPTNTEALDGTGAVYSITLQGPQTSRWKLLSVVPHLEIETSAGMIDSRKPEAVARHFLWVGEHSDGRTLINLTGVPHGKLRYVCEALVVPTEYPNDKPKQLTQSWLLNRTTLMPLWSQKSRVPLLSLSKFTITYIGSRTWTSKKGRLVQGELDFSVAKGAGPTLDVMPLGTPFESNYSVSPPLKTQKNGVALTHQTFSLDLTNSFVASRRLKTPVRISGLASTGGGWPLAFQIEHFDFNKVTVGQQFKAKFAPILPPTL